ncbi:MAG: chemotaxis protein CheA [Deltaproteobacteria bacterium]|nr:chemotaxis protein CheA [Deltaproteobacteria bacterium]
MDMTKYKPLFLSEAVEHFDAMEGELLGLEQEPDSADRIQELFRHLHSLKSMAASMGYDPLSKLAHRLEDFVSPHRDQGHALETGETDILIEGLDFMRKQVEAVVAEQDVPEMDVEFFARLTPWLRADAPTRATVNEVVRAAKPAPRPAVHQPLPEGYRGARVLVRVDPQCGLPSVRALLVLKRLSTLGRVLASEPSEQELRAARLPDGLLWINLETEIGMDEIRRALEDVPELVQVDVEPETSPAPESKAKPVSSNTGAESLQANPLGDTVRVRTELLDFVVDSIGELITLRSYFENLSEELEQPGLREGVRRMSAVVRRLQDRIMDVRMVPASMLTGRLPRVCRDLARARGKQVRFEVEGDKVELDRALVEELDTPLLHLLRNAVDHGLEGSEERRAAGKDVEGLIRLSIRRQQDRIIIELIDDGRGLDPQDLIERGQKAGWLQPGQQVSDQEALDWIFRPGFSTAETVSDTSGRGVGLDAVRSTLDRLNGRVEVHSRPGQGATFVLDLPLTLAIVQVLLVEVAGHVLAIPASRVLRAMALSLDLVAEGEGGLWMEAEGRRLPLVDLETLLEGGQVGAERRELVWLGRGDEPQIAMGFDRLTGHREVVLKSIGPLLRSIGPFSGTTVLGDGRPVLILDVDAVISMHQRGRQEPGA